MRSEDINSPTVKSAKVSSNFWAYLDLGLDVLNGVGGFGSKHVRISDDTDIKMVKEFIVNQ